METTRFELDLCVAHAALSQLSHVPMKLIISLIFENARKN